MDNLHIFLGATVADAAARPLHWIYDPKKLNQYIKGKKEIVFLKKNKSPFYSIKTGKVSGYNDVGQVMFKTVISTKKKSDVLKFVIGNREDFNWARDRITEFSLDKICTLLFSPTFGKIDPKIMVKWILAEILPVRMQMQMHKMIWSTDKQGV